MCKPSERRRRGLIDRIGTIAKSLIGTVDANDQKLINKQLNSLHDTQQTEQHVIKNQIKILQQTIARVDNTEQIIQNNKHLLANVTRDLREKIIN